MKKDEIIALISEAMKDGCDISEPCEIYNHINGKIAVDFDRIDNVESGDFGGVYASYWSHKLGKRIEVCEMFASFYSEDERASDDKKAEMIADAIMDAMSEARAIEESMTVAMRTA